MKQKKKTASIVTRKEYAHAISVIEELMKKGENNLSAREMSLLSKTTDLIESYEERNKMTPVPRNKQLAVENDPKKIAVVLGYEPDLLELIEFKMYQLKMNQNGLAGMLNMPASKISQIMNKKRDPDILFLKGIHEKLGIDGNYILERV